MRDFRVRAAINLEGMNSSTHHIRSHDLINIFALVAAGTTGRDLLFQATSEQMIHAYSHVPRYPLYLST